jgi:hypothetical protein
LPLPVLLVAAAPRAAAPTGPPRQQPRPLLLALALPLPLPCLMLVLARQHQRGRYGDILHLRPSQPAPGLASARLACSHTQQRAPQTLALLLSPPTPPLLPLRRLPAVLLRQLLRLLCLHACPCPGVAAPRRRPATPRR